MRGGATTHPEKLRPQPATAPRAPRAPAHPPPEPSLFFMLFRISADDRKCKRCDLTALHNRSHTCLQIDVAEALNTSPGEESDDTREARRLSLAEPGRYCGSTRGRSCPRSIADSLATSRQAPLNDELGDCVTQQRAPVRVLSAGNRSGDGD